MTGETTADPTRVGTPLHKHPEPELGHSIIPKDRYLDPLYAKLEWDHMWTRTWLYAGPVSDLEDVGDYFTFEIGTESVLIVKSAPDRIEALLNACQHRGSAIRQPGVGHARQLVCPYHLWTYDLTGQLVEVPDRDDFPQGIPADMCLPRVSCEVWNGFVWVNLDPHAAPLDEYLGVVAQHLDVYDFAQCYLAEDISFLWECNWKVGVDAFNEVYHVQGIHPELLEFTDDVDCPIDLFGDHSRFLFRIGNPTGRWTDEVAQKFGYPDRYAVTQMQRFLLERAGIDPSAFDGSSFDVRSALIDRMRPVMSQAFDVEQLNDEQLMIDVHYFIFPNITLNISVDHFWLFRHRPHPSDPNLMYWDFQEYKRLPKGMSRPERAEHIDTTWGEGHEQKLHLALQQDGWAAPPVQQGMRSAGFKGLWLAHQERRIRHFHEALERYVGDVADEALEGKDRETAKKGQVR